MDRIAAKPLEWKGIYDSLDVAQTSLGTALRDGAGDLQVDALRHQVERLRARSDFALKEMDERVAAFRLSRTQQH
jgi:hypothetical protein